MAQDYQGLVASENVGITAGCNQAFCVTLLALAAAGDNIILPEPYYFNHNMWLGMLGIEPRLVPGLTAEGAWPSVAAAASAMDGRTRAIALCSYDWLAYRPCSNSGQRHCSPARGGSDHHGTSETSRISHRGDWQMGLGFGKLNRHSEPKGIR